MEDRVLVSDDIGRSFLAVLEREGLACDHRPGLKGDDLSRAVGDATALIVRSATKVTADLLGHAEHLRVVARAGVGVDNVDVDAATRRGVVVMNTPDANTVAAAEHTFALILALARNVPQAAARMKAGGWDRGKFTGVELAGKTLGVVGLGRIGREVARRAQAFGMTVVGYDPFVTEDVAARLKVVVGSIEDIAARSDFVTVHVPLSDSTRGLLGAAFFDRARAGVRVVNCARGGVVDEAALLAALESGRVAGAALDVFEAEPPGATPLVLHERVITTPHLGASTQEALEGVGVQAAEQIAHYLRRGVAVNAVNAVSVDATTAERLRPHAVLAGLLGRIHADLLDGRIREVRLSFHGEAFEAAARRLVSASFLAGFLARSATRPVNQVNAFVVAEERGVRVVEEAAPTDPDYQSLLAATVITDRRGRTLAGTLFGQTTPVLVRLDSYATMIVPEGHLLFVSNNDTPGIMGMVGSHLGGHRINIANMSMGRDTTGGTAIAILSLDEPVPATVLDALAAKPGILWARAVTV